MHFQMLRLLFLIRLKFSILNPLWIIEFVGHPQMHCPQRTHSSGWEIILSSSFVALNILVGQIFVQRSHLEHVTGLTPIIGASKILFTIFLFFNKICWFMILYLPENVTRKREDLIYRSFIYVIFFAKNPSKHTGSPWMDSLNPRYKTRAIENVKPEWKMIARAGIMKTIIEEYIGFLQRANGPLVIRLQAGRISENIQLSIPKD